MEITERRTRIEFAHFIRRLLDEHYPDAVKVRLVMDNLNTHDTASLYATFEPAEPRRLADRLEIHYTQNMALLKQQETACFITQDLEGDFLFG